MANSFNTFTLANSERRLVQSIHYLRNDEDFEDRARPLIALKDLPKNKDGLEVVGLRVISFRYSLAFGTAVGDNFGLPIITSSEADAENVSKTNSAILFAMTNTNSDSYQDFEKFGGLPPTNTFKDPDDNDCLGDVYIYFYEGATESQEIKGYHLLMEFAKVYEKE